MSGYCGECPKCESALEVDERFAGTLQCSACGEALVFVHDRCLDCYTSEEYFNSYLITQAAYHRQMHRQ